MDWNEMMPGRWRAEASKGLQHRNPFLAELRLKIYRGSTMCWKYMMGVGYLFALLDAM